jgi:hypothetical protein
MNFTNKELKLIEQARVDEREKCKTLSCGVANCKIPANWCNKHLNYIIRETYAKGKKDGRLDGMAPSLLEDAYKKGIADERKRTVEMTMKMIKDMEITKPEIQASRSSPVPPKPSVLAEHQDGKSIADCKCPSCTKYREDWCNHKWGEGHTPDGKIHWEMCVKCNKKKDDCINDKPEKPHIHHGKEKDNKWKCEECGESHEWGEKPRRSLPTGKDASFSCGKSPRREG